MQTISVIILAGGASRRMGTNKALVELDNETLIERVVRHMAPLSDDLILVNNAPELYEHLPVRQVKDLYPDHGPLAGLHAGLMAARNDWAFAMACDMPLVDHRLVRYMVLLGQGHQAVVPRFQAELEPLHALYNKDCLPAIEEHLETGQRRVVSFFRSVHVRFVEEREVAIFDARGDTFFNVNTPEDLKRLQSMAGKRKRRRSARE